MSTELSYGNFAYVYDKLTDDVEYKRRSDYIESLIARHFDGKASLLCDLGCGTGTMCLLLDKKGYDCIGIDNSYSMLSVAMQKSTDGRILFINQDITDFELYGTVDVFVCLLDTINYLTEPYEIEKLMKLVENYLNPGGIFVFDFNTKYKFEKILASNTLVFEKDNIFYTWENYYEDELLDFHLNFFVSDGDGNYTRFCEDHCQRHYSMDFISQKAKEAGLTIEAFYGDLSFDKPQENDERAFCVLKKPMA